MLYLIDMSIVKDIPNIYEMTIHKDVFDKYNKRLWKFDCCFGEGLDWLNHEPIIHNYKYNNNYFLCYEMTINGEKKLFADPKRMMNRTSLKSYIQFRKDYLLNSTDLSLSKTDKSVRITNSIMNNNGIKNYVDLCCYYNKYSSIGAGMNRMTRNIVLFDIDVDCREENNKQALENLLQMMCDQDVLPTFIIHNDENGHVQLQWLILQVTYSDVYKPSIDDACEQMLHLGNGMFTAPNITTAINNTGKEYRALTQSLCDLVNIDKFGDPNFTYWRIKNFASAWKGLYNLRLEMPENDNGIIRYKTKEEIDELFDTENARRNFMFSSQSFFKLRDKLIKVGADFSKYLNGDSDELIEDDTDIETDEFKREREKGNGMMCRNSFVLYMTTTITWKLMREGVVTNLKKAAKKEVYDLFLEEDKKYKGCWPGTSKHDAYTKTQFNSTFKSAFEYATSIFKKNKFDKKDMENSIITRKSRKYLIMILTIYEMKRRQNISSKEITQYVNAHLKENVSWETIRKHMREINKMTPNDIIHMVCEFEKEYINRTEQYTKSIKGNVSNHSRENYKNRLEYIDCDVIKNILKNPKILL